MFFHYLVCLGLYLSVSCCEQFSVPFFNHNFNLVFHDIQFLSVLTLLNFQVVLDLRVDVLGEEFFECEDISLCLLIEKGNTLGDPLSHVIATSLREQEYILCDQSQVV